MLLTVSSNINDTLCYIICWHIFVRNAITSLMQIYFITCTLLDNWLDVSFYLFDSSSYKWSKSGIAFLETGIRFIFSYALYHTCIEQICFPTKTNHFIVLGISWDKIFTLFRNTKSIFFRKSIYNWCRSSFMYSYIVIYIVLKYILVFVDIFIHSIIDMRLCYFIFEDRNRLMFITDINRNKSSVVDFVIDIIPLVGLKWLPGIICVILSYIVFINIKLLY